MYVTYVCCHKQFEDHYTGQTGSGLPYYQGISRQKGYGLGGIFRRLFRAALLFLVKSGKTVGKEALSAATQVASDVLSGQDFKTSAEIRTKAAGRNLARKAIDKVHTMIGRGRNKRKRKISKRIISSKARKVKGRDIFDP